MSRINEKRETKVVETDLMTVTVTKDTMPYKNTMRRAIKVTFKRDLYAAMESDMMIEDCLGDKSRIGDEIMRILISKLEHMVSDTLRGAVKG
jgi:hypothetical protein